MNQLWRHQVNGIAFVEERWRRGQLGVMLAMIMGSGKSRVAVELARGHRLSPVLILSPLRVVQVWSEQFAQYSDYHFVALDSGSVAQKLDLAKQRLAWAKERQIPIAFGINYESARLNPFRKWALGRPWPLAIADESHRLKSPSGAISRFAGWLGHVAVRRLALTGTPMPHSPLDVWSQYRFLDRHVYDPTFSSFKLRYAKMGGYFNHDIKEFQNLDELREKFFSLAYQVGPEVLDLPGEQDQYLFTTLGSQAARMYASMERDLIAWIEAGSAVTAANALVRLLRLAQITSGVVPDAAGIERTVDTTKRELLEDLLEDLAPEEPVVVFARFKADLAAIREAAANTGRLAGELSGEHDDLAAWKRGRPSDPVVLAVQIQAGGVGIDLTRARIAVYHSIGFSLADYLQSRARIYRSGQTRPVMFYHLMTRNTTDEIVRRALEHRQDLVDTVLKELKECPKTMTASKVTSST